MKEEQNKNKIITNKTKWRKKYNRVTHKEWDCKDDLKLFTYDAYKSSAFNMAFLMIWQRQKQM